MTAVLLIIFNRPSTTRQVFEAIRCARPARLYIAADAPRPGNITDVEKCLATRAVTETIDWPCEVKRLYQEQNLGCSFGPRAAFSWFFSMEPEGIILEDDCVPHPDFFSFARAMLNRYRNDQRILSINGSNLGYQLSNGNSYTYSRFMNMWGWATWADRAQVIDYSLSEWKQVHKPLWFLYQRMRQGLFDTDINWYKYWQHKFDLTVTRETITWWDWQWIYHQLRNRKLSVVPSKNLISNIGFIEDATHTKASDNPAANLPLQSLPKQLKYPAEIKYDRVYEEFYVKWVWCYHKRLSAFFYLKQYISRLIGRNV
ncbi:MAG: nucleotide-diphospho-sugar transferase [Bacteroidetes bacterium]|nr:nucleotide-diphospho-sugar transferase [Bacteroidota bacterium]